MVRRTTQAGTVVLGDRLSTISLTRLAEGVIFVQTAGVGSTPVDQAFLEELDKELTKSAKIELYCDVRGQSRFARETRDIAVDWGKSHREVIVNTNILVTSRLMEMVLSVIGMMSGSPMTIYSNEQRFLAAVKRRVPSFRALPALTVA